MPFLVLWAEGIPQLEFLGKMESLWCYFKCQGIPIDLSRLRVEGATSVRSSIYILAYATNYTLAAEHDAPRPSLIRPKPSSMCTPAFWSLRRLHYCGLLDHAVDLGASRAQFGSPNPKLVVSKSGLTSEKINISFFKSILF